MIKRLSIILVMVILIPYDGIAQNNGTVDRISVAKSDFPVTVKRNGQVVKEISNQVISPRYCDISDSLMVIIDETEKNIFKFFSLKSQQLVGTYGRKGEGPGEISFLPTMIHHDFTEEGTFIYYDWGKKMLAKVSLQKAINSTGVEPESYYVLPPELIKTQRLTYLDENKIVGGGGITKGKLFLGNLDDSSFVYKPFIPKIEQSFPKRYIGHRYFGFLNISENRDNIIWANKNFPQFEVYSSTGDLKIITSYSDAPKQEFKNSGVTNDNTVIYHKDILSKNDRIYTLYVGKNYEEIGRENSTVNSELRIFDIQGNPIKRIVLDHYITKFDIRKDKIYGIAPYNKKGTVISFTLSK